MKEGFVLTVPASVLTWYLTSVVTFAVLRKEICSSLDDIDVTLLNEYAVVSGEVGEPHTISQTDDTLIYDDEGGSHYESTTHVLTQCPPRQAYTTTIKKLMSQNDFDQLVLSLPRNSTVFNQGSLPEHYETKKVKGTPGCSPYKPVQYWLPVGMETARHLCETDVVFNPGQLHGKVQGHLTMPDVFFRRTWSVAVPVGLLVLLLPGIIPLFKKVAVCLSGAQSRSLQQSDQMAILIHPPTSIEDSAIEQRVGDSIDFIEADQKDPANHIFGI